MKFNNQLADAIYTSDMEKLGENALQAMQNTIYQNGGVGTVTGYYDDDLTILSVSDLLLHNLNHSYASLMERTKGSLKNLFYGENVSFLEPERFRQIRGAGEGQIRSSQPMEHRSMCVVIKKKPWTQTAGRSGCCRCR